MLLGDPRVADVEQTCGACPEQYEGTLTDGRPFYFRYRHGYAGLGIGDDMYRMSDAGVTVSSDGAGCFESEDQRDEIFCRLLDEATASAAAVETTQQWGCIAAGNDRPLIVRDEAFARETAAFMHGLGLGEKYGVSVKVVRRMVTTFPDGSVLTGPFEEVSDVD